MFSDSKMEISEKMKMKEHKKRMIANQRQKKQAGLDNILRTIKKEIAELVDENTSENYLGGSFSSLYSPIPPILGEGPDCSGTSPSSSFWSCIPSPCTPDQAVLDSSTASQKLLRGEEARQTKYRKKLQMKVQCGDITEEEKEQLLQKFGRKNLKNDIGGNAEMDSFALLNASRGLRKRQQVENIASLFQMFGERNVVVDFGSGSGNLCLALASFYKNTTFVFADQNLESLEILSNRARQGGLTNVRVKTFSFNIENLEDLIKELVEELGSSFDLGIGLHCCGRFTDLVMEVSRLAKADCVVVPCCNGKIGKDKDDKDEENAKLNNYPRSSFISSLITRVEYLQVSRAADDENNYEAKCLIEYDRARWARENGYDVSLLRMEPVEATPKHHVLYSQFNGQ